MMREGQEVRMVANAEASASTEGNTSYGGRGSGRGSWRGGRGGRGSRIYTCFIYDKEGHFAIDYLDKPKPKEAAPAIIMINTADVNAITRSQSKLLAIEDKEKSKGKQKVSDEWSEQRLLAAKIAEEFAKMKPEKPETSQAREITKVLPKSSNNMWLTSSQNVWEQKS